MNKKLRIMNTMGLKIEELVISYNLSKQKMKNHLKEMM